VRKKYYIKIVSSVLNNNLVEVFIHLLLIQPCSALGGLGLFDCCEPGKFLGK